MLSYRLRKGKNSAPTEWLDRPPIGPLWLVDNILLQLVRHGVNIGQRTNETNQAMLNHAKHVFHDDGLWRRVPPMINYTPRELMRSQLGAALNHCRGFN